jgi:hypothetical protein
LGLPFGWQRSKGLTSKRAMLSVPEDVDLYLAGIVAFIITAIGVVAVVKEIGL